MTKAPVKLKTNSTLVFVFAGSSLDLNVFLYFLSPSVNCEIESAP